MNSNNNFSEEDNEYQLQPQLQPQEVLADDNRLPFKELQKVDLKPLPDRDTELKNFLENIITKKQLSVSEQRKIKNIIEERFLQFPVDKWFVYLIEILLPKQDFQESIKLLFDKKYQEFDSEEISRWLSQTIRLENLELVKHILKFAQPEQINTINRKGWNFLHIAVSKGLTEITELLLFFKIDTELKNHNGMTPFQLAVIKGYSEIVSILAKHNVNLNEIDSEGKSPLHLAVLNSNLDVVRLLIYLEVKIDIQDNEGNTPLNLAVQIGQKKILNSIIEANPNVDVKNKFGNSPLMSAIKIGNYELAKILINNYSDIEIKDKNGNTPLITAIKLDNYKIAEYLIEHNVSINQQDNLGQTALFNAVANSNTQLVNLLIESECDVNLTDNFDSTPLHKAIENSNLEIVKSILKNGGNITKDKAGFTTLHLAVEQTNIELIELFLIFGINATEPTLAGQTCFDITNHKGNFQARQYLADTEGVRYFQDEYDEENINQKRAIEILNLAENFDTDKKRVARLIEAATFILNKLGNPMTINDLIEQQNLVKIKQIKNELAQIALEERTNDGKTTLHIAVKNSSIDAIKHLLTLEEKSGLEIRDNQRRTPIFEAVLNNSIQAVELLINAGANPNIKDIDGITPLYLAKIKKHNEIINILEKKGAKL